MLILILNLCNSSTKSITVGNNNDKLTLTPLPDENAKSVKLAMAKMLLLLKKNTVMMMNLQITSH